MQTVDWDRVVESKSKRLDLKLSLLWRYRDLMFLLVKRDFISVYKQTILGPIWFIIQPLVATAIFTIVFSNFGGLSTDGAPSFLFYLSGITIWTYFSDCLIQTSETFIKNQNIFGKVYFPRIVVPVSIVISNLIKFGIQFLLFVIFWIYFFFSDNTIVSPNSTILFLPLLIIITAGISLGFGLIFASITSKYRDLRFLLQFGVQLLLYLSSVVIPISQIPERVAWIIKLNPIVSVVETFRYSFLGAGTYSPGGLVYSFVFMLLILFSGIIIFNRFEKSFVDSI